MKCKLFSLNSIESEPKKVVVSVVVIFIYVLAVVGLVLVVVVVVIIETFSRSLGSPNHVSTAKTVLRWVH